MKRSIYILIFVLSSFAIDDISFPVRPTTNTVISLSDYLKNLDSIVTKSNRVIDTLDNKFVRKLDLNDSIYDSIEVKFGKIDTIKGDSSYYRVYKGRKGRIDTIYADSSYHRVVKSPFGRITKLNGDTAVLNNYIGCSGLLSGVSMEIPQTGDANSYLTIDGSDIAEKGIKFKTNGTTTGKIYQPMDGNVNINVNDSDWIRITYNGLVGIGRDAVYNLDVNGTTRTTQLSTDSFYAVHWSVDSFTNAVKFNTTKHDSVYCVGNSKLGKKLGLGVNIPTWHDSISSILTLDGSRTDGTISARSTEVRISQGAKQLTSGTCVDTGWVYSNSGGSLHASMYSQGANNHNFWGTITSGTNGNGLIWSKIFDISDPANGKATLYGEAPLFVINNTYIDSSDAMGGGYLHFAGGSSSTQMGTYAYIRGCHQGNRNNLNGRMEFVIHNEGSIVTTMVIRAYSVYVQDTVNALVFTDRTPGFNGNALKEIRTIKNNKNGEINHSTLPVFARTKWKDNKTNKDVEGRDIGAMVSILTKAIQELSDRVDSLEFELRKR